MSTGCDAADEVWPGFQMVRTGMEARLPGIVTRKRLGLQEFHGKTLSWRLNLLEPEAVAAHPEFPENFYSSTRVQLLDSAVPG